VYIKELLFQDQVFSSVYLMISNNVGRNRENLLHSLQLCFSEHIRNFESRYVIQRDDDTEEIFYDFSTSKTGTIIRKVRPHITTSITLSFAPLFCYIIFVRAKSSS
jgi:hypothetical protein